MKNKILYIFLVCLIFSNIYSQTDTIASYGKKSYMITMRDGVKLFTVILSPIQQIKPNPFLLERTPYGVDIPLADNATIPLNKMGSLKKYARDGYIFVFQDLRGKFKSEGTFEMTRPLYHLIDKTKTDESTDAYDTVDWLVKNIPNNNGNAGIHGVSYPGYLALDASVDPHPALKASSPQASPADMFLGDDFHHNGAFRLSYGFEYSYLVENDKLSNSIFPFPQYDLYNWYLQLGSLKNVNEKFFKGKLPAWNDFTKHPNHDEYWIKSSTLTYITTPQIPILHVGGYFDQEDLNGPQLMYHHLEKKDVLNKNFICLGPWNHGGWEDENADSLGDIKFGSNTAAWFQTFEKQWFDFWLRGIGEGKFAEANCFQTGNNTWKTYDSWPPKMMELKKLYAHTNHKAEFTKPIATEGSLSYLSDPATPIPYRSLPIEATYADKSRWNSWHVEDQRFVSTRPDVVSFVMDSQKQNITVTGKVIAHLFASTTATDADFVVKLIDVYPAIDHTNIKMSGYQLPIAMEIIRGRFRKSFENPEPLKPGNIEEFVIDLHDINHTFLKGHQLMIQIQSTWFPIIDRNPQKYIPNIFEAQESDFVKATHTVYFNNQYATYLELPVVKE